MYGWLINSYGSFIINEEDALGYNAILQLKVMQSMYHVLLFLTVALNSRKGTNRGKISYAYERLHRHSIMSLNLDKMLFQSDR